MRPTFLVTDMIVSATRMRWGIKGNNTFRVGVQSFSELTSAEKSPFCRRMVLPPLAASIRVGIWARMAKASSMPTAVSTLLSITPIGGQTKPPTIRSIERCYFVNVILALTFMFFHNYALCEPYI